MGTFSIWHWLIVAVVVLLLFGGRGKLSGLMGDMAKGINAFKKGLKEEDKVSQGDEAPKAINAEAEPAKEDEAAKS